ncbi:MAG TPA: zf-HC2 domain-containing protein [Gemmatimonadales bacterium]|nr:zf-HC2 domain-containing protein [Gemmatimonadales bacterium]
MSHPDEGTIQALLDGELDAEERSRIELHLSACAACAARLAEAREFQQEADRLVEMVVVPPASVLRRGQRRRTVVRTLAWAASIAVAVAAGYWGRGTTSPRAELQEGDRPTQAVATAPPATTTTPPAAPAPAPALGKDADAGAAAKSRRSVEPPAAASPVIVSPLG